MWSAKVSPSDHDYAGPRSIADDHGSTDASLGFITESGTDGSAS